MASPELKPSKRGQDSLTEHGEFLEWWKNLAMNGTDTPYKLPLGEGKDTLICKMGLDDGNVPELTVTTSGVEAEAEAMAEDPDFAPWADVEIRPGVLINGALLEQPDVLAKLVELNIVQPSDLNPQK